MDTLGFEPRAFRMRSGCDTTTPCAPCIVRNLRELKYQRSSSPPYEAYPLRCHATHQRHYNRGHSQNKHQSKRDHNDRRRKPNLRARLSCTSMSTPDLALCQSISGLVVEYIVAIDVTRVRFPADAYICAGLRRLYLQSDRNRIKSLGS